MPTYVYPLYRGREPFPTHLYISHPPCKSQTEDSEEKESPEYSKEGTETVAVFEGDRDVHAEHTTYQIEWHKNGG